MNIWQFQSKLTHRLLLWSLFSVGLGALLQFPREHFLRGLGQQFAGWGFIDALIAIFGGRAAKKRYAELPDPLAPEIVEGETRKLRKVLWINTGLDVGYVVGGTALALTKGKTDSGWRGHGIGVIIQGGFLFFFDLFHARKLGKPN
jgi:hypothetical protein